MVMGMIRLDRDRTYRTEDGSVVRCLNSMAGQESGNEFFE